MRAAALLAVALMIQGATADPATSDPVTGLTVKRVVLVDSQGQVAGTLREKSPPTTPVSWERQEGTGPWRTLDVMEQSPHVLWLLDRSRNQEIRVDFPEARVRGRAASQTFPNANAWSNLPFRAGVYTTRDDMPAPGPTAPATGLTVREFVLKDSSGNVLSIFRERLPSTKPPTWEAQDPGQPWRGPLRVVDRGAHVLWLYDAGDNAEIRIEFPSLKVMGRPGSNKFPNPAPWSDLPVKAEATAGTPPPSAPPGPSPPPTGPTPGGPPAPGTGKTLTFHVRNEMGAPVELLQAASWPPRPGQGTLIDLLKPGQTGTYMAETGLGWVVRRASPDKTEVHRFQVTRKNELITVRPGLSGGASLRPAPGPGMPQPPPVHPGPAPIRETLSVTATVTLIGVWRHVNGDPEMDTDGRDRVPVDLRSRLSFNDDQVWVEVLFRCQEYGGDGTTYGGHWQKARAFSKARGDIPRNARIVGIRPYGGNERQWRLLSIGKQHGMQSVDTRGSYWDSLTFRVDSGSRRDGPNIGVRGTISLEVDIER